MVVGESTPNVVLKSGGLRGSLCAVDSLGGFDGNGLLDAMGSERGEEIGDDKDSVGTLCELVQVYF